MKGCFSWPGYSLFLIITLLSGIIHRGSNRKTCRNAPYIVAQYHILVGHRVVPFSAGTVLGNMINRPKGLCKHSISYPYIDLHSRTEWEPPIRAGRKHVSRTIYSSLFFTGNRKSGYISVSYLPRIWFWPLFIAVSSVRFCSISRNLWLAEFELEIRADYRFRQRLPANVICSWIIEFQGSWMKPFV